MADVPSFRDFSISKETLDGDKIDIRDVLNKPIIVTGYKISGSKYYGKGNSDKYVKLQFYFENDKSQERRVIFTGSRVLMDQLLEIDEELDTQNLQFLFRAEIVRISNYYSFV